METPVRTLRIPDEEVEAAIRKAESYGIKDDFTAMVRLALKKLRPARKAKAPVSHTV